MSYFQCAPNIPRRGHRALVLVEPKQEKPTVRWERFFKGRDSFPSPSFLRTSPLQVQSGVAPSRTQATGVLCTQGSEHLLREWRVPVGGLAGGLPSSRRSGSRALRGCRTTSHSPSLPSVAAGAAVVVTVASPSFWLARRVSVLPAAMPFTPRGPCSNAGCVCPAGCSRRFGASSGANGRVPHLVRQRELASHTCCRGGFA